MNSREVFPTSGNNISQLFSPSTHLAPTGAPFRSATLSGKYHFLFCASTLSIFNYQLNVQEDAIKLILEGNHVVLNIPTGGGKSFPQMAANEFAKGENHCFP